MSIYYVPHTSDPNRHNFLYAKVSCQETICAVWVWINGDFCLELVYICGDVQKVCGREQSEKNAWDSVRKIM